MHEQDRSGDAPASLDNEQVSDRDARAMRRLHNLISWSLPEFEPFTSHVELEFVRAYRRAFVLWQELGGAEAEGEQFRVRGESDLPPSDERKDTR